MLTKKRLKHIFKEKKGIYIATAALGICLVIISNTAISNNNAKQQEQIQNGYFDTYGQKLENKIESMLSKASGCENVEVMITFKNTYEYEIEEKQKDGLENTFLLSNTPPETQQIKEIVNPEIAGVMVVCKGITSQDDFNVLKKAVSTVLDISQNKIYIVGG